MDVAYSYILNVDAKVIILMVNTKFSHIFSKEFSGSVSGHLVKGAVECSKIKDFCTIKLE